MDRERDASILRDAREGDWKHEKTHGKPWNFPRSHASPSPSKERTGKVQVLQAFELGTDMTVKYTPKRYGTKYMIEFGDRKSGKEGGTLRTHAETES